MHLVLDRLGISDRHEADAHRSVLVRPDDNLVLPLGQDLPAKRLRPEPSQAGQVMSVNDNVVEADRHIDSMRGALDRIFRSPCACLALRIGSGVSPSTVLTAFGQ